jgi:Na+-translocating ferredoxin:NAD+ oxidoreductase subunit C
MNALVNLSKLIQSAKEIFPFHGGVHPPENKVQSTQLPIGQLALPELLVLPLRQHVGNLPKINVQVGDHVLKGQLLAEAEGTVSAAIHAPTSGVITAIADAIIPHPSGLPDRCISLQPDGKDQWIAHQGIDWQNAERSALVASLRNSGIVGLGGATFPTQIKLRSDGKSSVHTLVINAAECEPYITCDDMLMRERADEIVQGIAIAQYLLGAEKVLIGIEDNKPEAIAAMQAATKDKAMQVSVVPTLYPSGDARRLVYLLLGEEIPHNKRSTEVGLQVFNVATVLALHRYFNYGEPAIKRIVSMTGNVQQPQNFEVLFGTPLAHLIAAAGGAKADTSHFIMGGPMMGFDLPSTEVPITKAANCIIAVSPTLFAPPPPAMPCIRCARCADACPVSLQPQELYWFAKSDNFEKARDYKLFDCIECGACSYVCPSDIPLVQYYRYAKSEIIATDKAKEAANLARERNEARLARIEREKTERAQKHAERAAAGKEAAAEKLAAQKNVPDSQDDTAQKAAKQAAIAAAIERAKAAKAQLADASDAPKNVTNASESVQREIAEIDARRAAVGLASPAEDASQPVDADNQAKIAAAIERAKAAKAAAVAGNTEAATSVKTPPVIDAEKQAKIDAAIARAKAAKAAAMAQSDAKQTEAKPEVAEAKPEEVKLNTAPTQTVKAKTANTKAVSAKKIASEKVAGTTSQPVKKASTKKPVAKKVTPSKKTISKTVATDTEALDNKPFRIMEAMARAKAEKVSANAQHADVDQTIAADAEKKDS